MNSEGICIMQQDSKNDRLWVRYYDIWEVLETIYLLKRDEIQCIMKGMVELTYKMSVGTPRIH